MNLETRLLTSEQLDNLSLSGVPLEKTLDSLKLINTFLGNHIQLSRAVIRHCKSNKNKKSFTIVDLGCGGGDSVIHLSKKLKKHNINASFIGIDGNPKSITHAKTKSLKLTNLDFIVGDILASNFKIPDCDILISSHFIYHFNDHGLTYFLKKIKDTDVEHIIFSDLYRSRIAYYLFKIISPLLPISDIAKKDGLIAIQRAFSLQELKNIIEESGIIDFKISKKPFFRTITKIDL
ncbi:methyltransferase domain-containing protein [Aquimarina sp. AD10]|uniref:methyltransferase domain-containing protein n=1 Tax=Aquimarina sp. AD10 TaxID=1714849 RepID=UPI000E50D162|nr:methyltransferase domain-containing protein [Aquimarina sp. AD10]AXT61074.1 methyltransferase domain-containing protein [Aquimarina sp. AD10]RKM92751.1 methyltransferase domain-containing protein [Aquimarina sp. AD10]